MVAGGSGSRQEGYKGKVKVAGKVVAGKGRGRGKAVHGSVRAAASMSGREGEGGKAAALPGLRTSIGSRSPPPSSFPLFIVLDQKKRSSRKVRGRTRRLNAMQKISGSR